MTRRPINRRQFVVGTSAAAVLGMQAGCASVGGSSVVGKAGGKVVVVGGGYGGATAAKYIRLWSEGQVEVTLVEPADAFVSCPLSNLVLNGMSLQAVTLSYDRLRQQHGVRIVKDRANAIDVDKQQVRLASGGTLAYDRLVLSPGIDFMRDALPGLKLPDAQGKVLHAWKAGPQTVALQRQLQAMPDGGVYALTIPLTPYRCPPGPYERASLVAHYFSRLKPKSKVLVLDANEDITSKGALFKKVWAERYKGIIDYRPAHRLIDVDAATGTLKFDFNDDIQAQVLNVIPPQRAGAIAHDAGLTTADKRWCEVDWLTHESKAARHIHVLGDALQAASAMPKSGHMANQHGKVAAAAIVALLSGRDVNPLPIYNNTCYSFVNEAQAMHVASVHRYDAERQTMQPVPGAGGLSTAASDLEGGYAWAWARNIWADTLG
ncbi:FCSD flavin-binding domain-containing protein [Ottowia sp.]|uniref:FCSD flavin-binding domain-containing protein n=1 Tax=Ottowia sp. TaxID=1898956 RepID=UPI003A83DF34